MTVFGEEHLREHQQTQCDDGSGDHRIRRTDRAFRRCDGVGLVPVQLLGVRQDGLLQQRGGSAEVGNADGATIAVARPRCRHHPGVDGQLVGQVGQQRQRVDVVGRHAVRRGDQARGRLPDCGVVAVADVARFDAAGQKRGGRGRVGRRQRAVDPLRGIGQWLGVRAQIAQALLLVGHRRRGAHPHGQYRGHEHDGHHRDPAGRGPEEVDDGAVWFVEIDQLGLVECARLPTLHRTAVHSASPHRRLGPDQRYRTGLMRMIRTVAAARASRGWLRHTVSTPSQRFTEGGLPGIRRPGSARAPDNRPAAGRRRRSCGSRSPTGSNR